MVKLTLKPIRYRTVDAPQMLSLSTSGRQADAELERQIAMHWVNVPVAPRFALKAIVLGRAWWAPRRLCKAWVRALLTNDGLKVAIVGKAYTQRVRWCRLSIVRLRAVRW